MADQCPNPACGARDVATVLRCAKRYRLGSTEEVFHFRFACCRICRLGFVDPRPSAAVLSAFYPADYAYWAPARAELSIPARIKYSLAAWRHERVFERGVLPMLKSGIARIVENVGRRDASFTLGVPFCLPRHSTILDFGFGAGSFLLVLRAMGFTRLWGYDVEQNRPSRDRLQRAGVETFYGDELARLPEGFFDCIRLEHVLEHLPAPLETLCALREKLRPGGCLVATVPSIHAWEPVERLSGSPHLDHLQLPIHLWHHSIRSIRDFLAAADLNAIEVRCLRPFSYLSAVSRRPVP
jgi:SAM-dependent methyltransferase